MEKEVGPLSDGEIRTFAEFLKHPKVRERLQAEEARMAKAAEAKYEKGDPRKGAALFLGRAAFKNRGPACAACHHAGAWGGNFGPDLRGIHERMGTTALVSACEKTQFRVMDAAYRSKPVTRQEAIHLARYLEAVGSVNRGPEPGPSRVWAGALGFGLLSLGGIAAYYRRRPGGRGK
jgi:cytochrome c2